MTETKTTEGANKDLVAFNEVDFNKALTDFKNFEVLKDSLEQALITLGKDIEYNGSIEIDFFNPKATLQEIVLEAFRDKNSLGLSYEKLNEILSLPTKDVSFIISELEKCTVLEKPEAREFSQYATSLEEKERLRYANGLVRHLEAYREQAYGNTYGFTIIKGFTKPPIYISSDGKFHTNPYFVYDNFR